MQIGRVVGQAVSTVKHSTFTGWRLLLVQLLTVDGKEDGEPVLAVDSMGAGMLNRVILTNDGAGTRKLMNARTTPARWMVMGICDQ
jgi:ethanolamine utilization protein EutN